MKKIFLLSVILCNSVAHAEVNYLESQIRFQLPGEIKTVRQATLFFLASHQYKFIERDQIARSIASRRLPSGLVTGGIMTIEDALLRITSEDDAVVIDTKNRMVTFNKLEKELTR